MVYASREKDNKRLAIVVTTICCQKERERELFVRVFSPSLLSSFSVYSFFFWHQSTIAFPSCFYSSRSHTPSISLCILVYDHVQQSIELLPYVMFCTVVVRSHLLPFYFSFPPVSVSHHEIERTRRRREQTNMKSIFCILDIHCLVLYFSETKKIIIRSVSRWEKYQIISFVISLSISFSHHSFIRRRNGVERLCAHPIIEENGWKRDTLREKERETVMEQWASRETTTISHFDPLVSLLLLVSFLRRQWCVCVYAYEQPDERNMRIVLRDLIHFTPSVYEKYFEATAWPISVYVYASIEHTAGLFNINRLFFSSFFLDHSLK